MNVVDGGQGTQPEADILVVLARSFESSSPSLANGFRSIRRFSITLSCAVAAAAITGEEEWVGQ